MYSVLQNYVESIKSKAVNHDLTKAVTARLENYKSRVATLQEAALQRKDAALAFVKQYHDLVEDIVGEKREFVVTKAQQVKAQTGDYIETKRTQGQEVVAGVRKGLQERRDKLSASVSEKKERLTSSLAVVAESTLSYTVGVLAIGASIALRVNVAARDAAPPSVLETVDKRVEQLKPYAVRAVNGVQAVDSRLGGYGTAVVKRVSTGVSEKLQQRNSESEATTTTTAEPTATSS